MYRWEGRIERKRKNIDPAIKSWNSVARRLSSSSPPPAPSFPVTLPLYLSTTADDDAVKELETTLVKISSPDRGSKPA